MIQTNISLPENLKKWAEDRAWKSKPRKSLAGVIREALWVLKAKDAKEGPF